MGVGEVMGGETARGSKEGSISDAVVVVYCGCLQRWICISTLSHRNAQLGRGEARGRRSLPSLGLGSHLHRYKTPRGELREMEVSSGTHLRNKERAHRRPAWKSGR